MLLHQTHKCKKYVINLSAGPSIYPSIHNLYIFLNAHNSRNFIGYYGGLKCVSTNGWTRNKFATGKSADNPGVGLAYEKRRGQSLLVLNINHLLVSYLKLFSNMFCTPDSIFCNPENPGWANYFLRLLNFKINLFEIAYYIYIFM